MRRSRFIKQSGPYKVESCADGSLIVTPTWGQYEPWTPEEGGGPGLMSRLSLARHIEEFLNGQPTAVVPSEGQS